MANAEKNPFNDVTLWKLTVFMKLKKNVVTVVFY